MNGESGEFKQGNTVCFIEKHGRSCTLYNFHEEYLSESKISTKDCPSLSTDVNAK